MQKAAVIPVLVDLVCADKGGIKMKYQENECSLDFYVFYSDDGAVYKSRKFDTVADAHEFAGMLKGAYEYVQVISMYTEATVLDEPCPFCYPPENDERLVQGDYWWMRWDKYPVSDGHILLTPKRHIPEIDLMDKDEWNELQHMLTFALEAIYEHTACDGYNIGINYDESAGQTIEHLHVHVIPRVLGDCENPRGEVRNVKKPLVQY